MDQKNLDAGIEPTISRGDGQIHPVRGSIALSETERHEEIEKFQKAHQWDPNLPQAKADAISQALHVGEPETMFEVEKEMIEKSPYLEVQAAVRDIDDGEYTNTLRAWIIGMTMSTLVTGINMFLSMRSPSIAIPAVVVIIITYPIGHFWAKVMPMHKFNTFGLEWTLNPGRFSVKEHTVIALMAKITSDYAYSTNALEALQAKSLYNHPMGWGFALLFTLSSQLIGIALSGMFRRFLVWPAAMIWPGQFGTTSLLYALHDKRKAEPSETNGWKISQYRYFIYLTCGMFAYYWFPGVLWQGLSVFAFATWIKPENVVVNQLFGGFTGLSLIPITFDWTQISGYIQSPLLSPWHAHFNLLVGLVLVMIIPALGIAYSGAFYSDYLPINTSRTFDNTATRYNVTKILTPEFTLDLEKYKTYSPIFLAPTFFLNYGLSFAGLTASLVHTILFHRKEIWYRFKEARNQEPDIHFKMMKKYPEAPDWWYGVLWVVAMAFGLATVLGFETNMPWWSFLLSCLLAFIFIIPLCMIYGMTNIQISLNVLSPFLAGYIIPGRPIGNMIFKVFSTIVLGQAQVFSGDLKMAHYMKIPPRTTFACQVVAATWAVFVQISVMNWALGNISEICTPTQPSHFTCPNGSTFFSSSIVWGVIGPARVLGSNSMYSNIHFFWLAGAILPVIFYLALWKYPRSFVRYLNAPVILGSMGWLPPATPLNFSTWAVVGLTFNYFIQRRWNGWWKQYNYITSAALDSGLVICTLVVFFAITLPNVTVPQWWGNVQVFETLDYLGMARRKTVAEGETFGPTTW
ncbi:hypothetical protein LTR84_003860 [Exophiala bonariae]|uniref:OPT family small oligopeptide transporter n=1 Tax=Exophiala bonariae TaxID=1690606 RepID=A0AAV9NAE4_9EURO|nr:hypothetical protein LTR84_003860 [Exophiala bonariae]